MATSTSASVMRPWPVRPAEDVAEPVGEGVEHGRQSSAADGCARLGGSAPGRAADRGPDGRSSVSCRRRRARPRRRWGRSRAGRRPSRRRPRRAPARPSWRSMAKATPPLHVESSLVSAMAGQARRTRGRPSPGGGRSGRSWRRARRAPPAGPPAGAWSMVRRILASSSIRLDLVCSRPAVSTMTTSLPRAAAASMASKTTADGSAPGGVGDDGHVDAARPDGELLDGRRAERVGGREQHPGAQRLEAPGELGDGRRLAGAVDAHDEDDRRRCPARRLARPGHGLARREQGEELQLERPVPGVRSRRARARSHDLDGELRAEVGGDERLLDLLPGLVVGPPAPSSCAEAADEARGGVGSQAASWSRLRGRGRARADRLMRRAARSADRLVASGGRSRRAGARRRG